jgi:glycogen synthase
VFVAPRSLWGFSPNDKENAQFCAFSTLQTPKAWDAMVRRAMKSDHSWTAPAKKYVQMYEETLALW